MNSMRRLITLIEAAFLGGQNCWFHPETHEVIHASDHGDAVMNDPDAFDIEISVQQQMDHAFPHGSEEDEEDGWENTGDAEQGEVPHELNWSGGKWHRNDAWEQLAMNRGWVRIGGSNGQWAAYLSAASEEAAWYGAKFMLDSGALHDKLDIEISRRENQKYTTLSGETLKRFIKSGPSNAAKLLV